MATKDATQIIKQPTRTHLPNVVEVPEGDNNKYTTFALAIMKFPPIDIKQPEQVGQRITDYFQLCADSDMKPTVTAMALALGLDRRRLWEIKTGAAVGGHAQQQLPAETLDLIKKAYEILETTMENYANSGKINPVMAIFMMKNHFGYQDKTEYVLTPNQKQDSDYDAEDIRKRYLSDSPTIDSDS